MALHFLRTGKLEFADAAHLFARHEEDLDVYHTAADGAAFSFQKYWEDRPSHDSPDNCFGGGRPTHTWSQGYALQWLLTGDPRGKDAFDEIQEEVRLYLYESFSGEGHVSTSEIRTHGWLADNLVARWRVEPDAVLRTSTFGDKRIARAPLQHLYFLEPALAAYEEVFKGRDAAYASSLLGLVSRMVAWIGSVTYGGDTDGSARDPAREAGRPPRRARLPRGERGPDPGRGLPRRDAPGEARRPRRGGRRLRPRLPRHALGFAPDRTRLPRRPPPGRHDPVEPRAREPG